MEVSLTPQLQAQALQFNSTNAVQLYDDTLGAEEGLSILSVLSTQEGLGNTLNNQIKIDLISILNEIKDTDQLSLAEALKLELVLSVLNEQAVNGNTHVSLTDFYSVLFLLSVLIF